MTDTQKLTMAIRALWRIREITLLEHHYTASVKLAGIEGVYEGCLETLGLLPTDACECEDCQDAVDSGDKPCHSDCELDSPCQGCREARELAKDLDFERKLLEGFPV